MVDICMMCKKKQANHEGFFDRCEDFWPKVFRQKKDLKATILQIVRSAARHIN